MKLNKKRAKKEKPLTVFGTRVFASTSFSRKAKKARKTATKWYKRKGTLSGK